MIKSILSTGFLVGKNFIDPKIRNECLNVAKKHFEAQINSYKYGSNLYIDPSRAYLKDLSIYDVHRKTGGFFHGARDSKKVLDLAAKHGGFPAGIALHVTNFEEVAQARTYAGDKGVMVLVEADAAPHMDAYGNMQLSLHLHKKIIGVWEKDQGRVSTEVAACRACFEWFNQLKSPRS
jgi:hypothetical protein